MGDDDLCRDPFTAVSGVDGLDGVPQHPLSGLHRVLRARGWWYYDDGTGAADPFLAWLPSQPLWAFLPSLGDADEVPAFIDVFPATVWARDDHVQLHFAGPHGRPCGLHRPPASRHFAITAYNMDALLRLVPRAEARVISGAEVLACMASLNGCRPGVRPDCEHRPPAPA